MSDVPLDLASLAERIGCVERNVRRWQWVALLLCIALLAVSLTGLRYRGRAGEGPVRATRFALVNDAGKECGVWQFTDEGQQLRLFDETSTGIASAGIFVNGRKNTATMQVVGGVGYPKAYLCSDGTQGSYLYMSGRHVPAGEPAPTPVVEETLPPDVESSVQLFSQAKASLILERRNKEFPRVELTTGGRVSEPDGPGLIFKEPYLKARAALGRCNETSGAWRLVFKNAGGVTEHQFPGK